MAKVFSVTLSVIWLSLTKVPVSVTCGCKPVTDHVVNFHVGLRALLLSRGRGWW